MTDIDEAPTPVLPRELAEISDAVRAVGAPPTPILAAPYAIRLVDPDADAEMVSEWMNRPHLVEAWEYDWPPATEQILFAQSYAEAVFDSHHCDRERHRVEADIVDQARVAGDSADVDVHVVAKDFGKCGADRFWSRRLHGEGRYTPK